MSACMHASYIVNSPFSSYPVIPQKDGAEVGWIQTDEDVLIRVVVAPDTTSSDIKFEVQRLLSLRNTCGRPPLR